MPRGDTNRQRQQGLCAGGDLKERNGMTDAQWQAQHLVYERMVRAIMGCPVPIIAAVNGAAYGGGCVSWQQWPILSMLPSCPFCPDRGKAGYYSGGGGTQNLSRAIGERRAKELILSGRVFSAEDAHSWGLVNAVFEGDQLLAETENIARQIAYNGPVAVRQAKQAITRGMNMSPADGLALKLKPITVRCRPKTGWKGWPPLMAQAELYRSLGLNGLGDSQNMLHFKITGFSTSRPSTTTTPVEASH